MASLIESTNPTQSNQSAEKLLALIETMATLDAPIRLQDLAKKLDMNVSTVSRFLAPLQRRGYVDQDPETSKYFLTFKLCGIANHISSRLDICAIARSYMRNLAGIFKESVNLSIENDMSVLYVEVVSNPGKTVMVMQLIGHIAPLHCTGVGKLFLLGYNEQKIDQYIAVKGLTRFTGQTITEREKLLRELEEIRLRGYSLDNEECEDGARCVAAPIRDYTGRIVAGLSVSGPVTRMTDAYIHSNISYLLDTAEQISFRLDWKGV